MSEFIAFIIGLFIGAIFGVLIMACSSEQRKAAEVTSCRMMIEKGDIMLGVSFTLELEDHYGCSYWINGKTYKPGFHTFQYDHVVKFRFNHDYLVITYRLYEPTEHVETVKFYAYQVARLQLHRLY